MQSPPTRSPSQPPRPPTSVSRLSSSRPPRLLFLVAFLLSVILAFLLPRIPPRISLFVQPLFNRSFSTTTTTKFLSQIRNSKMSSSDELPYARERRIAELAVQRASRLTQSVYFSKVQGTVTKDDKSPVTFADFGAQALIFGALAHAFPDDEVLGEEDSADLRKNDELTNSLWDLVQQTLSSEGGAGESSSAVGASVTNNELGTIDSKEDMVAFIGKGATKSAATGRVWALDPVDGTKGFLRGEQYAIALALLVDGEVKVGALGCPNLPLDIDNVEGSAKGVIASAVRGQGAVVRPISSDFNTLPDTELAKVPQVSSASETRFCEGVEAGHSSHNTQAKIASLLDITQPSVRYDSQAKYAAMALGQAGIYLRLPTSMSYQEKIWDHAAGSVIVEEAGAIVTDMYGQPLDYTQGRTFKNNKGVIVVAKGIADEVLSVVKKVAEETYGPKPSL